MEPLSLEKNPVDKNSSRYSLSPLQTCCQTSYPILNKTSAFLTVNPALYSRAIALCLSLAPAILWSSQGPFLSTLPKAGCAACRTGFATPHILCLAISQGRQYFLHDRLMDNMNLSCTLLLSYLLIHFQRAQLWCVWCWGVGVNEYSLIQSSQKSLWSIKWSRHNTNG